MNHLEDDWELYWIKPKDAFSYFERDRMLMLKNSKTPS